MPETTDTWTGTCRSLWAPPIATCNAVAGVVLLVAHIPVPAVIVLVAGAAALPFVAIRVTVGPDGVRIAYWRLPWPTTRIPLTRIASAAPIDVRPMRWGGWGYRGSLRLARRAAVALRAGEGLRLDLHDGRVFVVTVDSADHAADVLNRLLADRPPTFLAE